jgi:hypothetical protein
MTNGTQLWLITLLLWTAWTLFRILEVITHTDLGDYGAAVEAVLYILIWLMLTGFAWAVTFGVLWWFQL